jgi:hypothetical protein
MSALSESPSVEHPPSRDILLSLIGAPESPKRYLAIQWSAMVLQSVLFVAARAWITSPLHRLVLILAIISISIHWLKNVRPPSLQLRRRGGKGLLLSGRFRERLLYMQDAVTPVSATLADGMLIFQVHRNGAIESLSLRGDAFGRIPPTAVISLWEAMRAGDDVGALFEARALRLTVRERRRTIGIVSIEPRWLAPTMLAGVFAICIATYLITHLQIR